MLTERVKDLEDKQEEDSDIGEVNDRDVSLDSDEREFLDNISWDTSSDEEDIELDNRIMDEAL